jgi:hypothetical protein
MRAFILIATLFLVAAFSTMASAYTCTPELIQFLDGEVMLGQITTFNQDELVQDVTLNNAPSSNTVLSLTLAGTPTTPSLRATVNGTPVTVTSNSGGLDISLARMDTACGARNIITLSAADRVSSPFGSISCLLNWRITAANPDC